MKMLAPMNIQLLESFVVNELCEFNPREKLADDITVTSLVKTTSVDRIPTRRTRCNFP